MPSMWSLAPAAGGGTVAARLAEAGCKCAVWRPAAIRASCSGGDSVQADRQPLCPTITTSRPSTPSPPRMRRCEWDFFVRHYDDEARQRRDPEYRRMRRRRSTASLPARRNPGRLHRAQCDDPGLPAQCRLGPIAELTGDRVGRRPACGAISSGSRPAGTDRSASLLAKFGINPTGHGWDGWLHTETGASARHVTATTGSRNDHSCQPSRPLRGGRPPQWLALAGLLEERLDPNDWRLVRPDATGIRYIPLTTGNHRGSVRASALLEVAASLSRPPADRARRAGHPRPVRRRQPGRRRRVPEGRAALPRARNPSDAPGEPATRRAPSREVILAGGAFNTPQLLMLSGIGPPDDAGAHRHSACASDLPGVGRNLQDRYEIGVVNRMNFEAWSAWPARPSIPATRSIVDWSRPGGAIRHQRLGPGCLSPVSRRAALPDLFCMALLGRFRGYFPGYSRDRSPEARTT